MQPNPLLSIVIPTYNRADFLDYCLELHIPLARAHNIELFVSDNASTDATADVVKKRAQEYPLLRYYRNESNIGAEDNIKRALNYPDTQYVWLLGDTYRIPSSGIDYLLNLITISSNKYDAIVFNLVDRIKDIRTQDFTDCNSLLYSLGALMTCLSCLVYSNNLIRKSDFNKYRKTQFMQTGIIFDIIAKQSFKIHWVQSLSVEGLANKVLKKNYWSMTENVFTIACTCWTDFVFSLPPSYRLDTKVKCIKDFTKLSDIFSFKHLLSLRKKNLLNYKVYKRYEHLFPLTIRYSKPTILTIALLPRLIPHIFFKARKRIRSFQQFPVKKLL